MNMIVEFDISADLIEVPEWVIRDREVLRCRFLKWLMGWEGSRRWRRGCGLPRRFAARNFHGYTHHDERKLLRQGSPVP